MRLVAAMRLLIVACILARLTFEEKCFKLIILIRDHGRPCIVVEKCLLMLFDARLLPEEHNLVQISLLALRGVLAAELVASRRLVDRLVSVESAGNGGKSRKNLQFDKLK